VPKCQRRAVAQKGEWRQFTQLGFADGQGQTGIATRHGVGDPVAFGGVEEQHLVCLGDGLVMPKMPHIDAAIRKHQLGGGRALFRARMRGAALAAHVPDRNGRRSQQILNGKLGHGCTSTSTGRRDWRSARRHDARSRSSPRRTGRPPPVRHYNNWGIEMANRIRMPPAIRVMHNVADRDT
jgi:hypothetical protein